MLKKYIEDQEDPGQIFPIFDGKFNRAYFPSEDADILQYCNGKNSINDIAVESLKPKEQVIEIIKKYADNGLLEASRPIPEIKPEIVQPTDKPSYLNYVHFNLLNEGFKGEIDLSSFPELVMGTTLQKVTVSLPLIVSVGYMNEITKSGIENFNTQVLSIGKVMAKGKMIGSIALLFSWTIQEDAKEWVRSVQITEFHNFLTLPVLFDLKSNELIYNPKTSGYGGMFRTYFKYIIEKCFSTSPEAKNVVEKRSIGEIILCVVCIITIISGLLLLLL
ncbi:MAG: hypothetical protein LUQ65_01015 [Candidatus Helarchaeota archaeon]|nr:hypothetical protein [Candidatus Helarchaeota archaeon]